MQHRIILILGTALLLWSTSVRANHTINFIADETTNFCNPERGFYMHTEQVVTSEGETNLSKSTFTNARKYGYTLLLRLYYFDNFRDADLPKAVLDQINSDFDLFRQNGCKAVLRFAYTNDNDNYPIKDGSPEIWKRHLEQLTPILHANADVIAVVQAGFLGAWGEWYFSSQGTGTGIAKWKKDSLINQLLRAVPASRAIQLRTPDYKRKYLGISDALPDEEAFSGTARARLGHHNDAFLYGSDNMGTYSNRTKDMAYLAQECLYLPNGGETDVYKEEVYKAWATGDKAQAEMAMLHYSYLNSGYAALTLNHWREDGSFDILARRMGYRFSLMEATLPQVQRPSEPLEVKFTIKNDGYATPYNERHAYVVLHNEDTTYVFALQSDPRFWAPNSAVTEIEESFTLPNNIKEGDYQIALWLPDADEKIAQDARFAIRLANVNVWDEETGYNNLSHVTVSATAPEPQPEPEPVPQTGVDPVTQLRGTSGMDCANLSWLNPGEGKQYDTITVDLSLGIDTSSVDFKEGQSSATVTYADGVSSVAYSTSSAWLWAGSKYPVSDFEADDIISFECIGDGQSISMYPYAHDGETLWRGSDYSVALNSKKWQSYSYRAGMALWSEPKYEFGEKKIIDLGFVANPATAKSGTFSLRNLKLVREHVVESDLAGVRVIRKEGSAPTGYSDGQLVYYGNSNRCKDGNLEYGHTYYYAAYAIDKEGKVALPATCSVMVDGSALPTIQTPVTINKHLINGHLIIEHNGHQYNVIGQPL